MDIHEFDALKLENQLCFPLYACSKEIIRRYKPLLDPLDLTYTQYIALMVLWEKEKNSVKELGEALYLDSGTLSPVLKKLENKNYIIRTRSHEDERSVFITLTNKGLALRKEAVVIPTKMGSCINLEPQEAAEMNRLLLKVLAGLE